MRKTRQYSKKRTKKASKHVEPEGIVSSIPPTAPIPKVEASNLEAYLSTKRPKQKISIKKVDLVLMLGAGMILQHLNEFVFRVVDDWKVKALLVSIEGIVFAFLILDSSLSQTNG